MTDAQAAYLRLKSESDRIEYEHVCQEYLAQIEGWTYVRPADVHTVNQYEGF